MAPRQARAKAFPRGATGHWALRSHPLQARACKPWEFSMRSSLQGTRASRQIQNPAGFFLVQPPAPVGVRWALQEAGVQLSEDCSSAFSAPTPVPSTGSLLMWQSRVTELTAPRARRPRRLLEVWPLFDPQRPLLPL